jgi:hypothetical protein
MKNNQTAARIPIPFISHIFSATKQQKFTTKSNVVNWVEEDWFLYSRKEAAAKGAHGDGGPAAGEVGVRVSLELVEVLQRG